MPMSIGGNPPSNYQNNQPKSTGQPLPPSIRHGYEVEMGADLSAVQIHESHVPTLKGAESYRDGNNIHFPPGKDPYSEEGQKTLAHELAHVVQQAGNPSTNPEVSAAGAAAGQSAEQQAAGY